MGTIVEVGREGDAPKPGEAISVMANDTPIAIFNVNDELYAINDICTHEEYPLSEGDVDEYCVECALHGARFDLRTGEVLSLPATEDVETYRVWIADGALNVELP